LKIAVSAKGSTLDAAVDPRFGRCQHFVIVDPDTMEYEGIENSSAMASGGAGIASAQLVVDKGIQAVLTGNCGPNAYQVLEAAEVEVITGVSGTVRDAIEGYKTGRFQASSGPSVKAHFGMGAEKSAGSSHEKNAAIGTPTLSQELDLLKKQIDEMGQQLQSILQRLDNLERKYNT